MSRRWLSTCGVSGLCAKGRREKVSRRARRWSGTARCGCSEPAAGAAKAGSVAGGATGSRGVLRWPSQPSAPASSRPSARGSSSPSARGSPSSAIAWRGAGHRALPRGDGVPLSATVLIRVNGLDLERAMGMRGVERVTAREGRLHPSIQLILSTSSSDQLSIVDERSCRYSRSGQRQVSGVHTEAPKFPVAAGATALPTATAASAPITCTAGVSLHLCFGRDAQPDRLQPGDAAEQQPRRRRPRPGRLPGEHAPRISRDDGRRRVF